MTTLIEPSVEGAEPASVAADAKATGLGRYILVRFLLIFPTVFILTTAVFVLMRVIGDPITAAFGDRLTPDQLHQRIHAAGYDRAILAQYGDYLADLLHGNFGTTLTDHVAVTDMLRTYGAATLELVAYSLVVALLLGPALGTLAARLRDRGVDAGLRIFAVLSYATPVFFLGLLLKLVFALWWGWLPVSGRLSTAHEIALDSHGGASGILLIDTIRFGDGSMVVDVLRHAVLPAVTLGLLSTGIFLRLFRANLMSTLDAEYVVAGRSRGVGEYRLTTRHALRPALIPIITVMGLQIASMLSGAVLTETTFEWKGLGYELTQYVQARDYVAVQGIVVLLAVVVAVVNFLVDVLAAFVDPRVRY
ncbi:ABC transporter permease [Frankia tisae]|uniref:ABC transporter permease n=1 Tax=Frankia tisae TaxID=2950104 RepID=UPI0021C06353|nr:ABC transporter permease [Frankia tisae]